MRNRHLLIPLAVLAVAAAAASAEMTASTAETPVPEDVAPAIAETLNTTCVVLADGDAPVFEFWFRKEIPLMRTPGDNEGLKTIDATTLAGVVRISKEWRDFRDDPVAPGVYTLRYAQQPVDGNHLGTSPTPHFFILVPAAQDDSLDTFLNEDRMFNVSLKSAQQNHPPAFNLRDAFLPEDELPALTEDFDETKLVQVELTGKPKDADPVNFTAAIVYEGHGEL